MKLILVPLLLFCSVVSAQNLGVGGKTYAPGTLSPTTIARLPTTGDTNRLWSITDGASSTDCTIGGGSTKLVCKWNGSAYIAVLTGTSAPGAGSVTTVSVVSANGLSGTVTNPTTTPSLTLDIAALDAAKIADGTVSSAEFQFINSLTSNAQTQINGKQATITFGTGVQTALGVNIGSPGAPILFNGAGGTPSSLALTNATGFPFATGGTGVLPVANGGTNCAVASITCINNISGGSLSGAVVGTTDSQALTNKTINGNTFTAGTYTLTGAAAKVFTFNNTLTLAGTDGSTLNVGTGGTLGSNAYTSTAYAPIASPTFTGTVTIPLLAVPVIGPSADSTTAVKITKADLSTVVGVWDTTNTRLRIGSGVAPTTTLDVTGVITASASVQAGSIVNIQTNNGGSPGLNGTYVGLIRISDEMNLNGYAGWRFYDTQGSATRMVLTQVGNLKIAGVAVRGTTEGTNHLDIFDGTAPVGTLANGITLYSTAGELRVMDSAGNATLLSPHDHRTNEWIYYSVNTVTGKVLKIDMERMMRALDTKLGGGFVHEYMSEVEARPDLRKAN